MDNFEPMTEQKALLVIDMQKGSFTPRTPRYDTDGVVERINELVKLFRTSNNPVFWIQHNGKEQNVFLPKTTEWELLDALISNDTDIYIEKYANDIFYNSELQTQLKSRSVGELYITGCATDFCVEATVQSALAKDYDITVVKNAHTTADRPHLIAEKVIEHYNWVWQHMIPTKGKIKVVDSEEIIRNVNIYNP